MNEGIAMKPATGEYSKTINYIYRQAIKMAKTGECKYKYAQCGDFYDGKGLRK
jgi:hypothetical protein